MNATDDDGDIKLQKISNDLLATFDSRLEPFLLKRGANGTSQPRSVVLLRDANYLRFNLLDPFQEFPQLLDPHLTKWLTLLSSTLLSHLQNRKARPRWRAKKDGDDEDAARSKLLISLPQAICEILYTLCKIRGEKVIVRFLNNEARHLETLLSALEDAEATGDPGDGDGSARGDWSWEERYVVLLWLSHLMLAPFDLATLSSGESSTSAHLHTIYGFTWPPSVPSILWRILPLAMKYLASPGKERDAAKILLIRIGMRRDVQELGVFNAVLRWALGSLRRPADAAEHDVYSTVGTLSFLAGILVSAGDSPVMRKYLSPIFEETHGMVSSEDEEGASSKQSALETRLVIKIMRSVAVINLREDDEDIMSMEMMESCIGQFLDLLTSTETPIRLTASKALSIITLKLDPKTASQVVQAVLESLRKNVLPSTGPTKSSLVTRSEDVSSVDPQEWHGLILTSSHLLYRRSPPAEDLAEIIPALLLGLSFEQRSASGGSIGTNVRDAACFGIWALARRYSTQELRSVSIESSKTSTLQLLATQLVVSACLDPAGNIRRGASAALQELIGRHPDTVSQGIAVVQTVDYHAVALRSRALLEVAIAAAELDHKYGMACLDALLGWRGIGDADAASRRAAASAYGSIVALILNDHGLSDLVCHTQILLAHLDGLQTRQVDERHGLLLALAATLDHLPNYSKKALAESFVSGDENLSHRMITRLLQLLQQSKETKFRKPELAAEATSQLFISYYPLLQNMMLPNVSPQVLPLITGNSMMKADQASLVASLTVWEDIDPQHRELLDSLTTLLDENLDTWLSYDDSIVVDATSQAALMLLMLSTKDARSRITTKWADKIRTRPSRTTVQTGYFYSLVASYRVARATGQTSDTTESASKDAILERWSHDSDVETRVAILRALTSSDLLLENVTSFTSLLSDGLEDYTTNARGDVGSHVRVEAIRAVSALWKFDSEASRAQEGKPSSIHFYQILRLAAEKLDRVRIEAKAALTLVLLHPKSMASLTHSSDLYFKALLDAASGHGLYEILQAQMDAEPSRGMDELLLGYASSADTGNEELVIASRAALTNYCCESQENLDRICDSLFRNLRRAQKQKLDRRLVPTLEVVAFLFTVDIFTRCRSIDYKALCLEIQRAAFKTNNTRKLDVCVKAYGGLAGMYGMDLDAMITVQLERSRGEGIGDARKRLAGLMVHPWPRIRSLVVDELWRLGLLDGHGEKQATSQLKGVDWSKASKSTIQELVQELKLVSG